MDRALRVLHWNARCLAQKLVLLRPLLREQNIDVALLSETFLSPTDRIKFPGYLIYRKDESEGYRRWRGLAVLVRRKIVHQPIPTTELASIYALGVELHLGGADLRIYATYKPPNVPL